MNEERGSPPPLPDLGPGVGSETGDGASAQDLVAWLEYVLRDPSVYEQLEDVAALLEPTTSNTLESVAGPSTLPDFQSGGRTVFDPSVYVEITELKKRTSRKYKALQTEHKVVFKNLDILDLENIFIRLTAILDYVIKSVTAHDAYNMVRFAVNSPSLEKPINLNFMAIDELSAARLIQAIERVEQSRREFYLDELTVYVVLLRVDSATGSGYRPGVRRRMEISLDRYIATSRCVMAVKNKDELCLSRAIVLAQIYARKKHGEEIDENELRQMRDDVRGVQTRMAKTLHDRAGLPYTACGMREARLFQNCLSTEFRLVIFSADHDFNVIFSGDETIMNIYLLFHDNHFSVVRSPTSLFAARGYCDSCLTPRYGKSHICKNVCFKCKQTEFHNKTALRLCDSCNRWFNNDRCFELHKGAVCDQIKRCTGCGSEIDGIHECNKCKQCGIVHQKGLCFVVPSKPPRKETQFLKVYYDIETFQKNSEHLAVLCVARFEQEDGSYITEQYYGLDCMKKFLDELLATTPIQGPLNSKKRKRTEPKHSKLRIIAHNAKSFDAHFVLQYLYEMRIRPEVIFDGSKIIFLEIPGLKMRFLDSYSFVPLPLRAFNKTFQLGPLAKTFFPYSFLSEDTLDYRGPLPGREFFQPEHFSIEDAAEFERWYLANEEKVFDVKSDLTEYCVTDVEVLQHGMDVFLSLFEKVTGINPLARNITLASVCNTVLFTHFLKPHSLGIVPYGGYRCLNNQSLFGLRCIRYYENKFETPFISALSPQGEYRAGPFALDGISHEKKIIIEAMGCLFHGHPACYKPGFKNPLTGDSMGSLYDRTVDRLGFIGREYPDYRIVTVWECEFNKLLREDPEAVSFVNSLNLQPPIHSRDALAGGRTEGFVTYRTLDRSSGFMFLFTYVNI